MIIIIYEHKITKKLRIKALIVILLNQNPFQLILEKIMNMLENFKIEKKK